MKLTIFLIIFECFLQLQCKNNDDLYELLGVSRDASVKDIRKAFKLLAVKLHPDKNKDDSNADAKFVKIARAYEILKDPDSRRHYDIHGDTESDNNNNQKYHSYTFYRDQFGIYDDDPLIVTLSRADYEVNILDNNQAWFVNFYSPQCHHCHTLAPTWRKLAAELEGVVRFGAVNCEDDWSLCYQLNIGSYPTLLYYEKESYLHEGDKYSGSKTFEALKNHILNKLSIVITEINYEQWEHNGWRKDQWILFLCGDGYDDGNCPESETMLKVTAIMEGLVQVGIVKDSDLCKKISKNYQTNPVIFWQTDKINKETEIISNVHVIEGFDTKTIVDQILNLLPDPELIDEKTFSDIRTDLRIDSNKPWLICFYIGQATELNLQLKRLPKMLPTIRLGLIHCGKSSRLCQSLHIPSYPSWGVLKVGGAFELHYGRDVLHEIATFARDSVKSTNLHALSPADFNHIVSEGSTWFIDWYAPWCPPCRKLMPELRRASQHFNSENVKFGTVDCTQHKNLCSKEGITSYPTTMLYNGSQIHRFQGVPSEDSIVEFVKDILNPIIINLDDNSFVKLMRKPKTELWIVDYFAPWCHPCQRLSPEWRKLAKQMQVFDNVKIAQVDCDKNSELCSSQNVNSYPTIRLYPLESIGLNTVAVYNGNRDVTSFKRWILNFLPTNIVQFNSKQFKDEILTRKFIMPWLVEFYAPWCGHCTDFEPIFRKVAERLEGTVRTAKIDCEAERIFCGQLYVNSYPTLLLYFSPNERHEIKQQDTSNLIRSVRSIISERNNHFKHDEL